MKIAEARLVFLKSLRHTYSAREAENLFRIIKEDVFLGESNLEPQHIEQLHHIIERLRRHEPIQYILGHADFYGIRLKVNPSVLIPRPETEELVYLIINEIKKQAGSLITRSSLSVLDIGTGCGCIAIALKKEIPSLSVTAIDTSKEALQTASENAYLNHAAITFLHLDFLNEDHWKTLGEFDIIVSNPPYITSPEMASLHPRVYRYEPHTALRAPHPDPFIFYKKITAFASKHMSTHGKVIVELNAAHATYINQIFSAAGYVTTLVSDMQQKPRVLIAIAPNHANNLS